MPAMASAHDPDIQDACFDGIFWVELGEKPKILANNSLKEPLMATPAIAGGAIYLRTEKHLYCIAAKK